MAQIDTLNNVGPVVSTDLALILRGGANVLGTLEGIVGQNSTVTITGGTIDGAVIGATTPAAVTTTALVATTADINSGTIDGAVIGGSTAAAITATGLNVTNSIVVGGTVDGRDVATDGTKLDGIESAATADQTNAEIRTAVEAATDSNVFTDADHTKLNALNQGVATTDSPAFAGLTLSGVPTAPTASSGTSTTQIATTAFTSTAIANLVASSPATLDTLNELAAALGDDPNFATTVTNSLALKAPIASPTFTGTATIPTADINAGTIDGTVIGATTAAAITATGLNVTSNIVVGGTVDGRDVATDGTKLDTVETNADVTDVTNVTAAGALMDSELSSIAAVKALNQGVATTDSPTFAAITATTADINSGTIDGTVIGGGTAAAITATTLNATGGGSLTGTWSNLGTVTTVDLNGGTIDGTTIGAATPAAVTTTALVATTADINAGTIDGTVIGGSTAAAGSFTTLGASGAATFSGAATVGTTLGVTGASTLTGGAYLGGVAAANLLDFYKEGTFTPVWTSATGSGTVTYGEQTGTYTRVGNLVTFFIEITTTSIASRTGDVTITGLPFTAAGTGGGAWAIGGIGLNLPATNDTYPVGKISGTSITMLLWDGGFPSSGADVNVFTAADWSDDGSLQLMGSYFV